MNRNEKAFILIALAILSVSATPDSLLIGNFLIEADNVVPIRVTPPRQSGQLATLDDIPGWPTPLPTPTPTPASSPTPTPTATPTPGTGLTVSLSATTARAGSVVNVTVSNGPGNPTDWIGLYAASNANNHQYLDWDYLNGTRSPTVGLPNASIAFTMPAAPGNYEFRFVPANGWTSTAKSPTISVTP